MYKFDKSEWITLYKSGMSTYQIAKKFGVSDYCVGSYFKSIGFSPGSKSGRQNRIQNKCSLCNEIKNPSDFYNSSRVLSKQSSGCKECYKRANRVYWAKGKYGLSQEDLEHLEKIYPSCAICHKEFTKTPSIDHCHSTGKVRGLLCSKCNYGLGHFEDDPKLLHNAIEYLMYSRGETV